MDQDKWLNEMQANASEVAALLKTMAHPERLLVLCQLAEGELSAGQLQACSHLSQSAFSQQLAVLKKQGLVLVRKEAQQVFYSLANQQAAKLVQCLHSIFCEEE